MKAPPCSFWVRRISRLYSIVPTLKSSEHRQDQRELGCRDAAAVARQPGDEVSHPGALPQNGSLRTAIAETCVTLSPMTSRIIGVTIPQS